MGLRSFFSGDEPADPRLYRRAIVVLLGVVVFTGLAAIISFFLALRGEEPTLVPRVEGLELATALVKLQEKELYPRISLRFSDDSNTKGTILEQDPPAGAIVKAGRRIELVVSRGTAIDRIGAYLGQDLDEVKIHLQTLFSASRQLIVIRDPVVYIYDESPAGTILEQRPQPETEIEGLTYIDFVVSRGPERARVRVPDLAGLSLVEAALQIEKSGVHFNFAVRNADSRERPGTVVSQVPVPGTVQSPSTPVTIVYALPAARDGFISGLFSRELPEYPYPLRVTLFVQTADGTKTPLITAEHSGGVFNLPYEVPVGSILILEVLNRVVARVEAGS
ncbi:MAG: hypothetical protein A2087_09160 [Spirochaetes bacterium GWD1_61_31]|nr:MAG: hypothetical protein A2Y37_02170 [Spirochaetes bacterium GWB1_60_80]OHD35270.1 MAG: hypothetical protein A2004_13435 [Spirochaetes bacterium GWC1_61_12]OHD36025.1 MAG: hypothetical protein A2087_09160 [Spirochaetes bacterium GWD1_61_31]OHD42222.1 MAG: hypothetical protein A2Y35_09745 [Spirochaetes bacterium GWE1_60_18]OHD57972.1 MAG: hypothetical protein A2Y32_14210 [Spirochaetes bacterium GWF1_60_12]HAP44395.1 penicillin-binding protein [Spirochaetaceae bacterium]